MVEDMERDLDVLFASLLGPESLAICTSPSLSFCSSGQSNGLPKEEQKPNDIREEECYERSAQATPDS